MSVDIKGYEPAQLPAPYSEEFIFNYRRRLKQLGISATVDNGIRTWRVLWRPFLAVPETYRKANGQLVIRRKSHQVRTRRFAVVNHESEEAAFREAAIVAAMAYRSPVARTMPIIDWEKMARAKGVKLRDSYAKPALNGKMDEAAELLAKGYGLQQVAQQLGVERSTVSRWRTRLRKENALP